MLDSTALRRFVGIDLGCERVPDATTLLNFRRRLEKHGLGAALLAKVGEVLQGHGMNVGTGTILDATIIGAPSSTKNAQGERDPETRQARKGKHRVNRLAEARWLGSVADNEPSYLPPGQAALP